MGIYHKPIGYQNNYIGTVDPLTGKFSDYPLKGKLPIKYGNVGDYDLSKKILIYYNADWVFFRNHIVIVDLSKNEVGPEIEMVLEEGHPDWFLVVSFDIFVAN